MARLIYVDEAPKMEVRNGMTAVTFKSGTEEISLILTFHATCGMSSRTHHAVNALCKEDGIAEARVVPFRKKKGGRK